MGWNGRVLGADWWEALSAFGTLGAVLVALAIPIYDYYRNSKNRIALEKEHRRKTASLVSAWVESKFIPSADGKYFIKSSVLYIANESDEPVYELDVDVAIGNPRRQIGPLSAPVPISVLPARRERSFDISTGLLAHEDPQGVINFGEPAARLSFTDRREVKWIRDYDGQLIEEADAKDHSLSATNDNDPSQIGIINPINPMAVAFAFYSYMVQNDEPKVESVRTLLDPTTGVWNDFDRSMLQEFRTNLSSMAMPAHVWYRTDRVAYVRLLEDSKIPENRSRKIRQSVEGRVALITLVFRNSYGWKIFAIGGGAASANWIEFETGELQSDIRSYLSSSSKTSKSTHVDSAPSPSPKRGRRK